MYQLNQIPSGAKIRKYLRRILFGKNLCCPVCHSQQIYQYENRYRCQKCRTKFSLLSHTWLSSMKISLQKFWLLLWCWTNQIPVKQSRKLCHLSEEAIRHWFDLFRANLPFNIEVLERMVQLDEAYSKGWAIMIGKQSGTRKLACQMIPGDSVQRQHAANFLQQYVQPKSRLHTDGSSIYRNIHRWWPVRHRCDIHRKWEFELTSEIEGVFGNMRTFIRRMYHHTTPEKMPEYVREFCSRFSLPEIFESPLTYLQNSLKLVPFD